MVNSGANTGGTLSAGGAGTIAAMPGTGGTVAPSGAGTSGGAGMTAGMPAGGSGGTVASTAGTGGVGSTAGTTGSSGAGGETASAGAGGSGATGEPACGSTTLLPVPDDVSQRGPWDVGVRTVTIDRLTVEILYPAEPGSSAGKPEVKYDQRDWLPMRERSKVPDERATSVGPIGGHLFRDLPIDAAHGPYPVVVFVHGTASTRGASITPNTHWASRGFVVVVADYPGLGLIDQLNSACGYPTTGQQDVLTDLENQFDALTAASGELAFLSGHIDMTRVGMVGHSQGGCLVASYNSLPNVQVVIPISASTTTSSKTALKSILYLGGITDTVIGYTRSLTGNFVCPLPASSVTGAFSASPGPPAVTKRVVGITGGGHLVPTDLCHVNSAGRNPIAEASYDRVCGIDTAALVGLPSLFDCGTITLEEGLKAVNYATTAALEETLLCKDRSAQFTNMQTAVPKIGDFQHQP